MPPLPVTISDWSGAGPVMPQAANASSASCSSVNGFGACLDANANGVALILYPLSAFRAMSHAALRVYEELRNAGSQRGTLAQMQTRAELYQVLGYEEYEKKLDQLFGEQTAGERE